MTLKQAKELSDYLKEKYGIEPAAGGGMMMAGPMAGGPGAAPAAVEKTEFDVVLTGFGDKKLNVVKVVKNHYRYLLDGLQEDGRSAPVTMKKASKEEAEKMKAELEEAGGSVELK